MNGILLVDKPQGLTSHDVVDKLRKTIHMRRIGHTGTLDPRATGLLILCIGHATRLSQHLSGLDKTYEGAMRLGMVTASHDMDGEVIEEHPVPESISREDIQSACNAFVGEIKQVPPMVSAVKVGGRRLYKIAREGGEVERAPRTITVHAFDILDWQRPEAELCIHCSSGAYVRTLCHDVGRRLGCGATLARLKRMRIGNYTLAHAAPLEELSSVEEVTARLVPMDEALDLPEVWVDKMREAIVRSGGAFSANALQTSCPVNHGWVQIKNSAGKLIGLGVVKATAAGARIQPKRVFGAPRQ